MNKLGMRCLCRHRKLNIISVAVEMNSMNAYNLAKRLNIKRSKQRVKNEALRYSIFHIKTFRCGVIIGNNVFF